MLTTLRQETEAPPDDSRMSSGAPSFPWALVATLPLALLVALVALAPPSAATHSATVPAPLPHWLLAEELDYINVTVDPGGTAGSPVFGVNFTVPEGTISPVITNHRVFRTDGTDDTGSWTIAVPSSTEIDLRRPGAGLTGESRNFSIAYTTAHHATDEDLSPGVNTTACSPGPPTVCHVSGLPPGTRTPFTVRVRVTGVRDLTIGGPLGSQEDGTTSTNMSVRFNATVVNHGNNAVNGVRVNLFTCATFPAGQVGCTSAGPIESNTTAPTFNLAAGEVVVKEVSLRTIASPMNPETRFITANLSVGSPVGRTGTLIVRAINFVSHNTTFANTTRFISADAGSPNQSTTVTVSWQNWGRTNASDVTARLDLYDAAGNNASGQFIINNPSFRVVIDAVTTSGSPTLTSGSAAFTAADVGRQVSGAGIPSSPPTTIAAVVSGTTATMSASATTSGNGVTATIVGRYASRVVTDGATTSGSSMLTSATFTGADIGRRVTGSGIPVGATIVGVVPGTQATMSLAATATGTNVVVTIVPIALYDEVAGFDPAAPVITALPFTVAPTGSAADGNYTAQVNWTFTDHNNNSVGFRNLVIQSKNTSVGTPNPHPNGYLVVDSTKPSADYSGATPAFNDRFERGGFNRVDFIIAVSDPPFAVNASRVTLEITPPRTPPVTAPYANRCAGVPLVCKDIMTQGTTQDDGSILFTNTTDFAQFEVRGTFNVKAVANDNAGNKREAAVLPIVLTDSVVPEITNVADSTSTGTALQSTPIRFSATVNDNFRVGRAGPAGETATLGNGVFLKLFDSNNNVVNLLGVCPDYDANEGCPMVFQGAANSYSRNGTYAVTTTVPHTGNITYKVFARDPAITGEGFRNFADAAGSRVLTINSAVAAFFRGSDGNHAEAIYSSAALHPGANQLQPARFGTPNTTLGTNPQDFQLVVRNEAGGVDTFVFECQVLSTSTLSGVPTVGGCEINNTVSLDTILPLNKNNTVTVAVQNATLPIRTVTDASLTAGSATLTSATAAFTSADLGKRLTGAGIPLGAVILGVSSPTTATMNASATVTASGVAVTIKSVPIPPQGVALTDQEERSLLLSVTVPPSARPGEVARILFIVKSRFVPSAQANVTLGYFVDEVRSVEFRYAPSTASSATIGIKPSRTILVPMLLSNPGNVPLRYQLLEPSMPTGWDFDWQSDDTRWNDLGSNVTLPAAGSGNATSPALQARIMAPINAAVGTLVPLNLEVQFPRADGTVASRTFPLTLRVDEATLTTPTSFVTISGTPQLWDLANNTQVDCPVTSCVFVPRTQVNFTLRADIWSSKNPLNPNAQGRIQPAFLVERPDGSVLNYTNWTLTSIPAAQTCTPCQPGGALLPGKNGTYEVNFTVLDQPGRFRFSLYVSDGFDQVFTNPLFDDATSLFTVCENPPDGGCAQVTFPTLSNREVREEQTLLSEDSNRRFVASFGNNITIKTTLSDNKHVGGIELKVEQVLPDGSLAFAERIRMTRTQNLQTDGERILSAVFEGTFRPTGILADRGGDYQFSLEAVDAVENPVIINTTSVFIVRLIDATGPVFRSVEITGGGRASNATILDVELGSGANLVAVVTDNGDISPGSNVDASTVRATLRTETGASLLNTTFTRSPSDPSRFTLDIPASTLAAPGNYSLELHACDLSANCAPTVLRTLRVLRNAAPELIVASPPETAGVRWAGPSAPIVVNVNDLNTDLTVPGRVLVEVTLTTTNATTTVTATPGGAVPSQTLTIPIPSGDATILVVVTDALNATSELRFSVRVDTTPPAGAVISVDPLDVTSATSVGKAFQVGTGPFTIAPVARLFVVADDTGSGAASVTVRATVEGNASTTTNFTLGAGERFRLSDRLPGLLSGQRVALAATATDRAGNTASGDATVVIDATPPVVGAVTPASPVSVRATDAGVGVFGVQVAWATTATGPRSTFDLAASGDTWSAEFPAEATGTVFFEVVATDKVGNEATQDCAGQPCRLDLGNRPPVFRAGSVKVEPLTGGVARGVVNITWEVTDPEGATVVVALRLSGAATRELSAGATSPFRWDTTQVSDGTYTLTVEASDGTQESTQTLTVRVQNLPAKAPPGTPSTVPAGGSIIVPFDPSVAGKEVKSVNAVFRPSGGSPETVPMTKQANGQWSVTYTPKLKAQYTVDLAVTFADNTTSTVQNYHAFSAEGQQVVNIIPLLPVALVALLVIALGALGIRRF